MKRFKIEKFEENFNRLLLPNNLISKEIDVPLSHFKVDYWAISIGRRSIAYFVVLDTLARDKKLKLNKVLGKKCIF